MGAQGIFLAFFKLGRSEIACYHAHVGLPAGGDTLGRRYMLQLVRPLTVLPL